MADQSTDILMKLQLPGSQHMTGEALTDLSNIESRKGMGRDFNKGYMFELTSFSLKLGTSGGEDRETEEKLSRDNNDAVRSYNFQKEFYDVLKERRRRLNGGQDDPDDTSEPPQPPEPKTSTSVGKYTRFREGGGGTYPVDMKPVEIKKNTDRSSILLMNHCLNRTVFKTASIIKRKAAGTVSSGEIFLRLDFDTVLFTEAGLSEGEPLEEKFKFICRAVTFSYRAQKDDGSLDAAVQGFWKTPLSKATQFVLQA